MYTRIERERHKVVEYNFIKILLYSLVYFNEFLFLFDVAVIVKGSLGSVEEVYVMVIMVSPILLCLFNIIIAVGWCE